MKKEKMHVAIVLDEYGGLTGMVTLDDIVNSVLGDIDDITSTSEAERIEKVSNKEYLISGESPLTAVSEALQINLPQDNRTKTIGGLVVKTMERIPVAGEKVTIGNYTFTIEEASDRQVLKIRFKR